MSLKQEDRCDSSCVTTTKLKPPYTGLIFSPTAVEVFFYKVANHINQTIKIDYMATS